MIHFGKSNNHLFQSNNIPPASGCKQIFCPAHLNRQHRPTKKKENPPTMQSPPTLVNNTFSDIQRIECTFDRKRKMNFIGLFYHNLFYKNGQFI